MKALKERLRIVTNHSDKFHFKSKLYAVVLAFAIILLMGSIASSAPLEVDSIVQLTSGSGNEGSPVWSPDGTEIAYNSDGNIYKISLADSN
ncbi:MAG: hypothetical protein R2741_10450 [Methanolobus sp.]